MLSSPQLRLSCALIVSALAALAWSLARRRQSGCAEEVPDRPGLLLRTLSRNDYDKGYFDLLQQLTAAPRVPKDAFCSRVRAVKHTHATVLVIEDTRRRVLVASATLLVESKFIRSCGRVGHIEDVVVDAACRGMGLGALLVRRLSAMAREIGCYKSILDCADGMVPFYEKCGFESKGVQMAQYF